MVKTQKDLTGLVFGEVLVLKQTGDHIYPKGKHIARWQCECLACGRIFDTNGKNLLSGCTTSCGCRRLEKCIKGRKKYNSYNLSGDFGIGYTASGAIFYFDLEDYNTIKDYNWYETSQGGVSYLATKIQDNGHRRQVLMHQIIMGRTWVDHINHDGKDNRKENLRPCTESENSINRRLMSNNTSGVTGVTYDKRYKKWHATIQREGVRENLGYYDDFDDAVVARLLAEQKVFGEWAPQKHLYTEYGVA